VPSSDRRNRSKPAARGGPILAPHLHINASSGHDRRRRCFSIIPAVSTPPPGLGKNGQRSVGRSRAVTVQRWRLSRVSAVIRVTSACSRSVGDDGSMASKGDPLTRSGQEWVVIASFANRHAAEHMLASLGHEFRRNARKGHAEASVVSGNADGSLKLTESRALQASGFAATIIRVSLSWTVGFMGPGLDGEGRQGHGARVSQTWVARRVG
jgi:hypothetical protein